MVFLYPSRDMCGFRCWSSDIRVSAAFLTQRAKQTYTLPRALARTRAGTIVDCTQRFSESSTVLVWMLGNSCNGLMARSLHVKMNVSSLIRNIFRYLRDRRMTEIQGMPNITKSILTKNCDHVLHPETTQLVGSNILNISLLIRISEVLLLVDLSPLTL